MMSMNKLKNITLLKIFALNRRLFLCSLFCLVFSNEASADTIYQWTDPWGQIKYSKTQVSGSMVSELTELPKMQIFTDHQKQQAMLIKLKEIKHTNSIYLEKKSEKKFLMQQRKQNENHCRKLRSMLSDIRLRNTRRYYPGYFYGDPYYQGRAYFPGRYIYAYDYQYDFLENDLYREIRGYCR